MKARAQIAADLETYPRPTQLVEPPGDLYYNCGRKKFIEQLQLGDTLVELNRGFNASTIVVVSSIGGEENNGKAAFGIATIILIIGCYILRYCEYISLLQMDAVVLWCVIAG